jgi:anti-anti-sigma factor
MTAKSSPATFALEGNRLTVSGEIVPQAEARYAEALFELLETEFEELVIDLAGLDYLCSGYVGAMCMFAHAAARGGRSVLVTASPEVGRILTMTGFNRLAQVQVENEESSSLKYAVDGSTLVVGGNVFDDEIESLQAATRKLLETEYRELVIDMSDVARIRGSHLGVLAATLAEAKQEGRSVTIVAVRAVRSLLEAVRLCDSGKLQIIPASQPSDEVVND